MRKLKTERRPEILDAALALADERGLDAVSMRAVAERIGVTPMAIYGYFRNKDELLDGLVGSLLSAMPPVGDLPWDQRLAAFAQRTRQVARDHPAVFPLLLARTSVTDEGVRAVDLLYGALLEAGIPEADVPRIERLVSTFVLGFAISEVNGRFAAPAARAGRGRDLPAHRRLAPYLDTPVDWDEEFAADLRDLIHIVRHV
ncbi:MAG: TetR family transcriptional regulator [Nonomuraea sp.]|nr:TetR family transcriptional regulator [Nonomuraea sp.]